MPMSLPGRVTVYLHVLRICNCQKLSDNKCLKFAPNTAVVEVRYEVRLICYFQNGI